MCTEAEKKRSCPVRNAVVLFLIFVAGLEFGFCDTPDGLICENLSSFYRLWKDAGFGNDPNRTERAAWVILGPGGSYSFERWPSSGARNSEIWRGPIPGNAVAQVHTHTAIADEKPSRSDTRAAQRTGMTIYVISSKGIWSVSPNGLKKKQSSQPWQRDGTCFARNER